MTEVRTLLTRDGLDRICGLLLTATGEVYLAVHRPCSIGEIRKRRIVHRDTQRGFVEEGESILNYKILDFVDASSVEQMARAFGREEALVQGRIWTRVHAD